MQSRKLLKYTLLALAALVVVLGVVIAYVAVTFDPRDYHDRIVALVREKTGRSLDIRGEIALSWWPNVAVRVGALTLSERDSDERFLGIDSARAALKLAPLLSGELVVSELAIDGAQIRITRYEDGRLNIDDLLQGDGPAPRFDIGRLSIDRSAITYREIANGSQIELAEITLETGRLVDRAPTPIALAMLAADSGDTFRVHVKLQGRMELDLERQRYALAQATVAVDGRVPGMAELRARASGDAQARLSPHELNVTALSSSVSGRRGEEVISVTLQSPRAVIVPGAAHAEDVRMAAHIEGPAGTTEAKLALRTIKRDADDIRAESAAIDLALRRGDHRFHGSIATSLEAAIASRELAFRHVDANFGVAGPRLPPKGLTGALKGEARLDARREGVSVRLAGSVGESNVKARVTAAGFAAPVFTFAVDVDQLDLERVFINAARSGEKPSSSDLDSALLQPFEGLPATGTITVGVLKSAALKARNVQLDVK